MGKKILFVCTGNTCRSSMAEVIALKIIGENPEKFPDTFVTSAGTYAVEGVPANNHAIEIAEEKGINLKDFHSKPITPELLNEADLILTMTNTHKQELLKLAPEVKDKVFLLKEYTNYLKQGENIQTKIEKIYININTKQKEFLEKHKNKLQELEKRKEELEKELGKVMFQMDMLQEQLEVTIQKERNELLAIEKELSSLEVRDPFGQPLEVYRDSYHELYEAIEKVLERIAGEEDG